MPHPSPWRRVKANAAILNIAHRGARAFAPENTLAAFAKAKQFGCQMIELDVRMSRDQVIVVYHDEHLLRCSNAAQQFPHHNGYHLADFSYAQLAHLDAGSWYLQELQLEAKQRCGYLQELSAAELAEFLPKTAQTLYGDGRIKIPTLGQTLAQAKSARMQVNIELKSLADPAQTAAMAKAVVALVEAMKMVDQVLISAFDHALLQQVRALSNDIATGVLTDELLDDPVGYLQTLDADAYNLGFSDANQYDLKAVTRQISALRAKHYGVNIWTCNQPEHIKILLSAGVTGIISDYPNRVRQQLIAQGQH